VARLINLHSVGTVVDGDTKLCYPMQLDGSPDMDEGCTTPLGTDDESFDWWNAMSLDDFELIAHLMPWSLDAILEYMNREE